MNIFNNSYNSLNSKIKNNLSNNNILNNSNNLSQIYGNNNNNNNNSHINNNNNNNKDTNDKKYIKKFAFKSLAGRQEYGKRKTNQDNFICMENILNCEEFKIFGVFDGHGK